MKNKNKIDWNIKSVGYNIENGGNVLDDRNWSGEWDEYWEEGESVSFEEGLEELKEYVCDDRGQSRNGKVKWEKMERMLKEIKEEVGEDGDWRLWGVEYDWNFGVEI